MTRMLRFNFYFCFFFTTLNGGGNQWVRRLEGTLRCGRTEAQLLDEFEAVQRPGQPNPLHLYRCSGDPQHICCFVCARLSNTMQWSCACLSPLELDTRVDCIVDDVLREIQQLRRLELQEEDA